MRGRSFLDLRDCAAGPVACGSPSRSCRTTGHDSISFRAFIRRERLLRGVGGQTHREAIYLANRVPIRQDVLPRPDARGSRPALWGLRMAVHEERAPLT